MGKKASSFISKLNVADKLECGPVLCTSEKDKCTEDPACECTTLGETKAPRTTLPDKKPCWVCENKG